MSPPYSPTLTATPIVFGKHEHTAQEHIIAIDRRKFMLTTGSAAVAGLAAYFAFRPGYDMAGGGGLSHDLTADPAGILDLPPGFSYRIISKRGMPMSDGLLTPGQFDGMAAFAGENGRIILVRNHEVTEGDDDNGAFGTDNERLSPEIKAAMYDAGTEDTRALGGTTTLVYDPATGTLDAQYLSLAGTVRNCAGGPTPWGSWLSCEESLAGPEDDLLERHGYVFEVPARADPGLTKAAPLGAMGRFNHEAAAVDPRTGIVYLTEDRGNSLLYRFLPDVPGELARGGRLQALVSKGARDTRNWKKVAYTVGASVGAGWIDLPEPDRARDDLRAIGATAGAAIFARGEGAWWDGSDLYFTCTTGGSDENGQIWRLRPGNDETDDELTLFAEPNDSDIMNMPDNIVSAPWGGLLVCEDSLRRDRLIGVRENGEIYAVARNALNWDELTGVCFSPDGQTLFVNMQVEDLTFAINGPWQNLAG